jgi:hypothetical protein
MKSRSNLESFEIVRISAGSVTTTMSVIPGKYVRFMLGHSVERRRRRVVRVPEGNLQEMDFSRLRDERK